jgi:hypothetical protein
MSDLKPKPELKCRHCGASNDPGASECWLCQRRDWRGFTGFAPEPIATYPQPRGLLSTIAGWMVLIAMIAVGLAVFQLAPGLGIIWLFFVGPAWAITEVKARRRIYRSLTPMSGIEKALWIMGLTILIPVTVIVALVVALATFCAIFAH